MVALCCPDFPPIAYTTDDRTVAVFGLQRYNFFLREKNRFEKTLYPTISYLLNRLLQQINTKTDKNGYFNYIFSMVTAQKNF